MSSKNNYKIYVHVFPGGKRYVGCTSKPLKERWNGGLGYENQKSMFHAIITHGWNNTRHYVIMDNLSREEALLYEAAFIRGWKTYMKSKGYNTVIPNIQGADEINVPNFRDCPKTLIPDFYKEETKERFEKKYNNPNRRTKRVRCIETGEVFPDSEAAAMRFDYWSKTTIINAIKTGKPAGRVERYSEEDQLDYTIPAHWEYVD